MATNIILNGTSSSGKTTLLKALRDHLQEPYLEMVPDRFIGMLPSRYFNRPLWDDTLGKTHQSGPLGLVLLSGMHHAIASASQRGNSILAAHVFVEKGGVEECATLFAETNACRIVLYCPLKILERRERGRRDRTLGQARTQIDVIHKSAGYDLDVDTSVLNSAECAQKIVERIKSPPEAFRQLQVLHKLLNLNPNSCLYFGI